MRSFAAVGWISGRSDIQHKQRSEQPKQPDTERNSSGQQPEQLGSVVHNQHNAVFDEHSTLDEQQL